jgi:hypothetical protein
MTALIASIQSALQRKARWEMQTVDADNPALTIMSKEHNLCAGVALRRV